MKIFAWMLKILLYIYTAKYLLWAAPAEHKSFIIRIRKRVKEYWYRTKEPDNEKTIVKLTCERRSVVFSPEICPDKYWFKETYNLNAEFSDLYKLFWTMTRF